MNETVIASLLVVTVIVVAILAAVFITLNEWVLLGIVFVAHVPFWMIVDRKSGKGWFHWLKR